MTRKKNRVKVHPTKKIATMRKLIFICIALLGMQDAFSQCFGDFYAFYTFPQNTSDSSNWEKLDFSFYNASDLSSWTMTYEYVKKGEQPTGATLYEITFNELNEHVPVEIQLDIEHGQKYDLYVCGELAGEFQDAHPLLELNEDFEYQKNRLYHFPFSFDKDLANSSSEIFAHVLSEPGNKYLFAQNVETCDLLPVKLNTTVNVKASLKPDTESQNCYVFIEKAEDFSVGYGHFSNLNTTCCNWLDYEEDIEISYTNPNWAEYHALRFHNTGVPNGIPQTPYREEKMDNISLKAIGERIEICASGSATIYGQDQTEEGLYLDTIQGSSGHDSVIVTTLIHHPPLFVDKLGDDLYRATGSWDQYAWYNCVDSALMGSGSEFQPIYNGSYFVVASDYSGCSDTSACFGVMNVGIEELPETSVSVYPNPAEDIIYMDVVNALEGTATLSDFLGRKLRVLNLTEGEEQYSFDVSDYVPGIYLIEIRIDGERVQSEKIIVK